MVDLFSSLFAATETTGTSGTGSGRSTRQGSSLDFSLAMSLATQQIDGADDSATFQSLSFSAMFSSRGEYASGLFDSLLPTDTPFGASGPYKTLDEVGQDFLADFQSLSGTLMSLFSGAGILSSTSIDMRLDGVGGVTTTSAGNDAAAGRAGTAFQRNGTLVNRFAVMAARGAIAEAAGAVDGFEEAYANDPAGAIHSYIDELENLLFDFTLSASSDGIDYSFDAGDAVAGVDAAEGVA